MIAPPPAPVVVHLLRHGAPARPGRLLGHTDAPVTPAGIDACRRAAARLPAGLAVVSSDLARAHDCAAAIAADRGVAAPRIDARWREMAFGAWDDADPAALPADALARFWDDPDGCAPTGGETWSALVARIDAALGALTAPTIVVTHAGAMRAALAAVCAIDRAGGWSLHLPYAAVLSLALWRDAGGRRSAQITGLFA